MTNHIHMQAAALWVAIVILFAAIRVQGFAPDPSNAQIDLSGRWIATADQYGTTSYILFELAQNGETIAGSFGGRRLDGSVHGDAVRFVATTDSGLRTEVAAKIERERLSGTIVDTNAADIAHPSSYPFSAVRVPARSSRPARRHDLVPTVFYRDYSAAHPPALTIAPGDTVHTTTVDAGGADANGVKRSRGGNPETGPIYVETAMPGDTLVVRVLSLKLNRDYAGSDDAIVESGLNSALAVRVKDNGKSILWHLDPARGLATPANPSEHLAKYGVPLRPMLGCIATAPPPAQPAPAAVDSGNWGGNMDFNEIGEGATVYLPVANPGALLYLGDGHAAMGDGEVNGNALETSMDVELTVDVIPGKRLRFPRVETPTHIIAIGLEGSLDDAFRSATANMAQWLSEDYALTPSEVAQVIGTAAEYKVSEVADRNSGIVLKISKELLRPLSRSK